MGKSYKETMNLPLTKFAMRARLPENEPKRLEKWESEQIYWKVLEKNKNGTPFVLHDGPPYANGPIHIGHAFNKILKDFVVKSHAQRGYYTPYVPGWDCHGQPIEHMVELTLGPDKMAKINQPTLRRLCREWAEKYVDIQREGFKRLGVNADWDHPYLTYLPEYESGNVEIFKKMYLGGAIYRGRKPIHWCMSCQTALAEAEIEYADDEGDSIYVKFKLTESPAAFAGAHKPVHLLIWTTTPWTLPANVAAALSPDAEYVAVETERELLILAESLLESVSSVAGWKEVRLYKNEKGEPVKVKGSDLEGMEYLHPIFGEKKLGLVVTADYVELSVGTGAVHTAPGHGEDDFLLGQKKGLPTLMPVNDQGVFDEGGGPFASLNVWDANPQIIEWLKEEGSLLAVQTITHSYPHCWRCHEPVIFRATDQWFVSMDKTGLREKTLKSIRDEVQWIPEWAVNRIGSMVADRPDWCISRQRSWGVPIPVFTCAHCGETVATEESFDAVIDLFRSEGADAWFTKKPEEYLPEGICCPQCKSTDLIPERDILDVWWESGVSHTSVLKYREAEGLRYPADMYLEGSDQHRGWFQSSILTSVGAYGMAPYKSVMHCGFTMDAEGKKMSKSAGNGIDPADVMKTYGADVLRLWVSSVDYSQDVNIGEEILQRVSDAYRRIRNSFRFLLGNLYDFDYQKDGISDWDSLYPIDQWAMLRTRELLHEVEKSYEAYQYHMVYRNVYEFINNDLSAIYMDICKDRLYSEAPNSPARRSAQTVLFNILEVLVRVMAPILSFTTDEVWGYYTEGIRSKDGHAENVQLAGWPEDGDFTPPLPHDGTEQLKSFNTLLEIREAVTKALEDARGDKLIGKSQEAVVKIIVPNEMYGVVKSYSPAVLEELFIVGEVIYEEGEDLAIEITASKKEKCPRCWNYREIGVNLRHPEVCERCAAVLDELEIVK